jgi:hypothetical protein
MRIRPGRSAALAIMLALTACTPGPDATDAAADGGPGDTLATTPATSPATVAPEVPAGAFFLDLRSGTQTPLPSTSIEIHGVPSTVATTTSPPPTAL